MQALYGLNPYEFRASELVKAGDILGSFFLWDVVSPYGPAWTALCVAIVTILGSAPLLAQVIAIKLIAALAQIALACGSARLTQLIAPKFTAAAFVFIAFNPLYLIEGPGTGHNDLSMLALLVWGAICWQQGFFKRASLLLGLAGAIKFLPFVLLFWLAAQRLFRRETDLKASLILLGIGLAPFFFLQSFFLVSNTGFFLAPVTHFFDTTGKHAFPAAEGIAPFASMVGVCSFAVIMTRLMHWSVAWTLVTGLAMVMIGPPWPWYLTWSGAFLFAGYSRWLRLSVVPFICAAFLLTFGYSIVP
jgi:hypothetical protein